MFKVSKKMLAVLLTAAMITGEITWANQSELETSTVLLAIKSGDDLIEEEPLFEILDFDKYVLVPLNGLSAYLPFNITFDREANTVTVEDQISKRQAIIDLKNRKYVVEGELRWPLGDQPPISLNGEFYVSPSLIEYLVDVKIDWSYKYQELIIHADWMEKKQDYRATGDEGEENDTKINYLEGSPYSIGSIRYKLGWEYREDENNVTSSEGSLELRGDGRAGDWAISLGGKVEYESDQETEVIPSLIRAKYNENNQLIILGDADVFFENTLEQQRVRGFLYMTPDDAFSRYLAPHTVISGPAEPGDKVTLLVNGKEKGGLVIGTKSKGYRFDNVPLLINRLNIIKVIVEKPSGEQFVTEEKIAASLRILEDGTHSIMAASGKYKKYQDDEDWVGEMAGFKTRHKLFNNTISFDCEATRTKLLNVDDNDNPAGIGADTGIAFRIGEHTVCALDWLVGGAETDLKNGWESSLLYCLERGFIEGIVFYVDPTISDDDWVETKSGKGFQVLGEIEISDRTSYETEAEVVDGLPGMDPFYSLEYVDVKRVHKFGPTLDNKYTVGFSNINLEKTCEYSIDKYQEDLSRIYSEQYVFKKNYSLNNYFAYDKIDFEHQNKAGAQNVVTTETDYVQMLTDTWLLRISNDYQLMDGDKSPDRESSPGADWSFESELQWVSPKMWLGANYEVFYKKENEAHFEPMSRKIEFWNKYFFNEQLTLSSNLARILMDQDYYTSAELNLNYFIGKSKDKYYASLEYLSPYKTRQEPQFSYKIGLIRNFKNGLEFKLETERLYETIIDDNPEKVIRLSLGQAIGFDGGRSKTVRPDSNNLSFINGLVYLDENGNRQYDDGEKRLPNIKMSLNGRVAVSDENGEYIFNYVQPGTYQLDFALKSLTADYTPATDVKLLRIRETENMFFDFGLTMNGAISGKVFLDVNSNGIYDQGDKPLNWVELDLDGGQKKIFTNNDGTFYFENVPLGEHTLAVMEESIPKEMMLVGEKSFAFTLKEEALDVSDLQIRVVYKFKE